MPRAAAPTPGSGSSSAPVSRSDQPRKSARPSKKRVRYDAASDDDAEQGDDYSPVLAQKGGARGAGKGAKSEKSFGMLAADAVFRERTKLDESVVTEYKKELQQAISGGIAAADGLVNDSKQQMQDKLAQFPTDKTRPTLVNDSEQYSVLVSKLRKWSDALIDTSKKFSTDQEDPDDELYHAVEEKFALRIQDSKKMQKQTSRLVIRLLSEYRSSAAQSYGTQRETYKLLKEAARA